MKYLLTYLFLGLFSLSGNVKAQVAWEHEVKIVYLSTDSLGRLYFKDNNGKYFKFHDQEFFQPILNMPSDLDSALNKNIMSFKTKGGYLKVNNECILTELDGVAKKYCKSFSFSCGVIYNEKLILGTKGYGLWVFDQDAIRKYYINGVYFPDHIIDLQATEGRLWILSNEGQLYLFDTYLQTLRPVASHVNAFHIDPWEVVWTSHNATLRKDIRFINDLPPSLMSRYNEDISLKDPECNLIFDSHYSPYPSGINLEYSINNGDWAVTDGKERISLSDLPSGQNKISIRAVADDRMSEVVDVNYSLNIPWWKTYWPYIFGCLLGLMGLSMLSQILQSRTRRRLRAETESIRKELENFKLQQKLGQLQMNPHFIFNVLNSISGLIATGDQKGSRKSLNSFAQMMRTVLDGSSKEWISLDREVSFLTHYLELEQMAHGQKFDFEIYESDTKNIWIPPMLIQPFVENAILHGLKHKNSPGKLDISFSVLQNMIQVEVTDNGIGRAAAAKYRKEGHDSHALNIVKERINSIVKDPKKDYVVIEDLKSPTGEALGTKVIILIPYKKSE